MNGEALRSVPAPLGIFGPMPPTPFELDSKELNDLRDGLDKVTRSAVSRYLSTGTVILALMEHTSDVIGISFGVSGGSSILTDGTYYWRRDAVDYVSMYGIKIDINAIEHMRRLNWKAPMIPDAMALQIDAYLAEILRPSR